MNRKKTNGRLLSVKGKEVKRKVKGATVQVVEGVERICALCFTPILPGKRWADHHLSYKENITGITCYPCHLWMHGNGRVWKHPIKERWGKDGQDMAALEFACRVVWLYSKAGIVFRSKE